MRQSTLSIHSENILPIIKKWLYSDKEIFLRELISNATDAIQKLKMISEAENLPATQGKISIEIDSATQTISISDNGIGMSEKEVETYIAQIAFSGAEEFVAKYKDQKEPIIGHFGLGFYSAYMVASKVEIETKSYREEEMAVFWSCDGSQAYEIGSSQRQERGTTIRLYLNEESLDYLKEEKIQELLDRYCLFMSVPIALNGKELGNKAPLWSKAPSECEEKEYLEFYHRLFPTDPDPLFWIHLNVDYPFHLKGILFFPKTQRRWEKEESSIRLFCNRVFVSDQCREILPDYLTMLKGAIDSPDIPLNVSRSYLQVDHNVRQLSSHISKKVSDRLAVLHKSDKEKYITSWPDIETIVKLGILQDEKFFEKIKPHLIWKTSEEKGSTLEEYLERAAKKTIYYTSSEQESPLIALYKEKKIEILFASNPIDTPLIQHLEEKLSYSFQRIDGKLPDDLLDPSREKNLLTSSGKSIATEIASFIQSSLAQGDLKVEAKSLDSNELPALVVFDEHQRRLRDYMAMTQANGSRLPVKKTLVVNTNHPLVQRIETLKEQRPETAQLLAQGIYDLSLLAQREVAPGDLADLISRQTRLLNALGEVYANG